MSAIIGSIIGFVGAVIPDVFRLVQESRDRAHELAIFKLQIEQQRQGHTQRLEEINATADISEARTIYKTYNTGVKWVDALNGTVRPVIAYAFFTLYACVKFTTDTPIWSTEDQVIFAGIISFYFGQRAMNKIRK